MKPAVIIRSCLWWLIPVLLLLWGNAVHGLDVPPLQGRVNDYAHLLSPSTINQLEITLRELETTDSTQIVVLTIPSLEGENLESFSLKFAETHGIGQKAFDNGALLLIAKDDRKIRIEVGYGLEGVLTDMIAGRIIRNQITPLFRNGNFDQGVINGIDTMVSVVRGEYNASDATATRSKRDHDFGGLLTSLVFVLFFFGSMLREKKALAALVGGIVAPLIGLLFFSLSALVIMALIPLGMIGGLMASILTSSGSRPGLSRRHRSVPPYIGGGGFGGSSGGFGGFSGGGGGFGGGGASGGW